MNLKVASLHGDSLPAPSGSRVGYLSNGSCLRKSIGKACRLWFLLLAVSAFSQSAPSKDQNAPSACPVDAQVSVENTSTSLNIPNYVGYRRPVAGDYVVVQYNAKSERTTWNDYNRTFDFKSQNNRSHAIDLNGTFLPVIYTREKLAVRVCGLHFTDVLTVTTSPNAVVEGGADIRGATVVPPPVGGNLSATLDMLQTGTATGGTTALPGLGLSAPGQEPSSSVTGIVPGFMSSEDQTPGKYPNYTPATVTASGKQVALQLYSLKLNAEELIKLVNRTMGIPYGESEDYEGPHAPGSVLGLRSILERVLTSVESNKHDLGNNAEFDSDMTDIQNVNAQISTLSSSLSSQAFASNTLTLLSNYAALKGIMDLAQLGLNQENCQANQPLVHPGIPSLDDLKKLSFEDFANWTPAQILMLTKTEIGQLPVNDSKGKPVRAPVQTLWSTLQNLKLTPMNPPNDQPLCSTFEREKFKEFRESYRDQVLHIGVVIEHDKKAEYDPEKYVHDFEESVGYQLNLLNGELNKLRAAVGDIDRKTTTLYDAMNDWYFNSSVEQTDLLQVQSQNAYLRISIVVQRGYTPFTIANASGTITPAVSTNVPPTTAGTATTSTPAHAVKTILVEVHRLANFNLMGGVMLIHVPTASYNTQASLTPATASTSSPTGYSGTCGGQSVNVPAAPGATPPVNYSCIIQTQKTEWQVAGMAGLVWYPWGRDYFPRRSGYASFGRNLAPSLLLATSVTSLGNSMGGINWEPISGIDFYGGVASAHKTILPNGLTANSAVPSGYALNNVTQEHVGLSLGVGMDLSVITSLFGGKTSAASMP
jgi:hypothetical protein